jgi:hypothetical protein
MKKPEKLPDTLKRIVTKNHLLSLQDDHHIISEMIPKFQ